MKSKNKFYTALEMAVFFIVVFFAAFGDIFYSFDNMLRDRLYQTPRGINNKIKIIAIDDKTLEELGTFGTWSRQTYADIINILGEYPAVIAPDIMIFGEMDKAGDDALINACRENGNVVAGSYINYSPAFVTDEKGRQYIDYFHIDSVSEPIVADVCRTGFVNAATDEDGILRSAFMSQSSPEINGGEIINSFSSEIYSLYCRKTGTPEYIPTLDDNGRFWVNYAGRPGDYEHVSFVDALNGNVDPRIFTDCIVLIGAYAAGMQDQYSVPGSSSQMYGVEIHANIIQGLMDGKSPVPANRWYAALVSAAAAVLIYFISRQYKLKISTPVTFVGMIVLTLVYMLMNSFGTAFPLIYTLLFMVVGYLINLVRKYVHESLEKKKVTDAFRKYVAPQVVDEITSKGNYTIKLGGENRHIAVLFVDIRGFTPMSESLEPEQVVDILNSYLNLTTNAIFKNGGTLDKFIGDATMAVFNAPFDLDDYIFRAVKTAIDIVNGGNEIESKFLEKYGKSVAFGVGVNCGNAVVGNIGCDFRMDYTAIGDTVNTAARLEANAKRGQVLISEYVYEQVKDRVEVEPIGEIPLKGKSKGVFVYSLKSINENSTPAETAEPDVSDAVQTVQ